MGNLFYDPFRPKTKKQRQREQLQRNVDKGKTTENRAMFEARMRGMEVERTGHSHDFIARKRDLFTGHVIKTEYHEVKSGGKVDRYDDDSLLW